MVDIPISAWLDALAAAPDHLRRLCARLDPNKLALRPAQDQFSPLENVWHLRDIEMEGYLVRIEQILTNDTPVLGDIKGDQLAIDRRYNELALEPAIEGFSAARAASMQLLRSATSNDWTRQALFEGQMLTLAGLVEVMMEHDRGHFSCLEGIHVASLAA